MKPLKKPKAKTVAAWSRVIRIFITPSWNWEQRWEGLHSLARQTGFPLFPPCWVLTVYTHKQWLLSLTHFLCDSWFLSCSHGLVDDCYGVGHLPRRWPVFCSWARRAFSTKCPETQTKQTEENNKTWLAFSEECIWLWLRLSMCVWRGRMFCEI